MPLIDRLLDHAASLLKGLVAIFLGIMLLINGVNIFSRAVFGIAFGWVFYWTMLLFVWLLLFGFFVYVRTRRDVMVDIFVSRLPFFPRLAVAIAGDAVGILVMVVMLAAAPDLLQLQQANMEAIALPIYVRSLPLFISATLVLIHFANEIVSLLSGRAAPFSGRPGEASKPGPLE